MTLPDRMLLFLVFWSVLSSLVIALGWLLCFVFRSHPSNTKSTVYTSTLFSILLIPISLLVTPWFQRFAGFEAGVSAFQRVEVISSLLEKLEPVARPDSAILPSPAVDSSVSPTENVSFSSRVVLFIRQHCFAILHFGLVGLWMAGVLYYFLRWLESWWNTARLLGKAKKVDNPDILGAVERLRQLLFLNARLTIKHASYKVSPFVTGLWKPVLFLPSEYVARAVKQDFSAIITHELAHVLRHDLVVHYLMQIVHILLWFLPPVEFLRRELIKNQDCACDEYAAVVLGSGIDYGEALTHYAEFCLESHLAPLGFAQEHHSLFERLVNITSFSFQRMNKISYSFRLFLLTNSLAVFLVSAMIGQALGLPVPATRDSATVRATGSFGESVENPLAVQIYHKSQWRKVTEENPSSRAFHAMVYESASSKVLLFGGWNSSWESLGDTWEWNGSAWTQRSSGQSPSARAQAAIAYDSVRRKVVLYGGVGSGNTILNDTWEWDGARWTLLNSTTQPSARQQSAMVFDRTKNKILLFGGFEPGYQLCNDTWEWDGTNWTLLNPATKPPARHGHMMAYDTARNRTVLFGGDLGRGPRTNDTWEWDGNNWTFKNVSTRPYQRASAGLMTYDSQRKRVILCGGTELSVWLIDMWEWDGTQWMETTASQIPFPRHGHAIIFDENRNQILVYGGYYGTGFTGHTFFNDTWIFGPYNPQTTQNHPPVVSQTIPDKTR